MPSEDYEGFVRSEYRGFVLVARGDKVVVFSDGVEVEGGFTSGVDAERWIDGYIRGSEDNA